MAEVPKHIAELIAKFDQNLDAYHAAAYGETEVRVEFINPCFEALGWDVANRSGYAEAYKDVIHEDAIKIGGATKAPDYCFRIGGMRKFFLEAKKPATNIKDDINPAFQLRRYAWSAKLPLSILTNFEEFAVYDCRIKPDQADRASTARILYLTYTEYAQRWDEIAAIFSRDAVLKGSFDRYADTSKGKKGTAAVDATFLKEIEAWREALARNLALRNSGLTQHELNFAVQRTIDRIIFLRMCEDRGIEPYGQLQALLNGEHTYERLRYFYGLADDRYNSGLFHFKAEKGRAEAPDALAYALTIDDKVLKDILRRLYYPESPYEFSVLGADILGNVYEQFLGKVIRLTPGHRAVVEDKPEVKKAGGVYYTPTYIVDYIVRHTVGKLCEGKTPKQIAKLSILDPACGSGSFLIGTYAYLLNYHRDWYVEDDPRRHTKEIYQGMGGQWFLTTQEKKRILLNNIYGVDIDSQAVEVTKLSLLLKVLEGENQDSLTRQLKMWRERALPDLGNNIKCGNSLIGPDFYDYQQMSLLSEDERYRINIFDWQTEFPEIMQSGGFDAVIGNPPYVVIGNDIYPKLVVDHLNRFAVAQYKTDLFHLFIQRGIDLLRRGGSLGFIVPNTWLTLQFTDKLRKYMLDTSAVLELVPFEQRVFPSADVHTTLLFLEKSHPKPKHMVRVKKPVHVNTAKELEETQASEVAQTSWQEAIGYRFETRLTSDAGILASRLMAEFPRLDSVARASLGCQAYNSSKHSMEQIANRIFHSTHKAGRDYLPELAGKDVSRYLITRTKGEWIKYGPWLHDYRTMDWLQGPRILIREIAGKRPYQIHACYVEETYCHYKTILNVNPSEATTFSVKYLTGLLNSRLMSFLYPFVSNKMVAQTFPRLSVGDMKRLPIRIIDFSNKADKLRHDQLVELVEQMLDLHKQLAAAKTPDDKTRLQRQIDATDRLIDRLVYELYGLTQEEVEIIEAAT